MNNHLAWVDAYYKYMRKADFENAIPLKDAHFPKSLYKYRNLNPNTITCLKKDWLWCSPLSQLNDVFECPLPINHSSIIKNMIRNGEFNKRRLLQNKRPFTEFEINILLDERFDDEDLIPENAKEKLEHFWEEMQKDLRKDITICSFSNTKESLLMWAHYANEFKGICIEYDFLDSEARPWIQPVKYTNSIDEVLTIEDVTILHTVANANIKATEWSYEQEWRATLFTQTQITIDKNHLSVPIPKKIYLGTRFEQNSRELISEFYEIIKRKEIPVIQIRMHPNQYRIIEE